MPLLIEELEREGEELIATLGLKDHWYNPLSFGLSAHGYRLVGTFANTLYPDLAPVHEFSAVEKGDTIIAQGQGRYVIRLPYEDIPF